MPCFSMLRAESISARRPALTGFLNRLFLTDLSTRSISALAFASIASD
jgi:hypothetical protein